MIDASDGSAVIGEEASAAVRGLVRCQGGGRSGIHISYDPPVRGERRTLSVAEAEAKKRKLGANSDAIKYRENKG